MIAPAPALYGSRGWTDDEFVSQFEACRYPNSEFRHADHIRLAWIYVRRYGVMRAEQKIAFSIRSFAASLGHPEKYHDTITRAWLRLVGTASRQTPRIENFDRFIAAHAWLLEQDSLAAFYSRELLASEAARNRWREPDLQALPCATTF
jgi:hypothetical protein